MWVRIGLFLKSILALRRAKTEVKNGATPHQAVVVTYPYVGGPGARAVSVRGRSRGARPANCCSGLEPLLRRREMVTLDGGLRFDLS
ncbi:hypothetical protein EVAR_65377_1 [Eumeta japonica]|uniref:Secreted protein n=1 Tax=Eumeta variegata TaxID=151549 RepID=A0A4C2A009_EUMVA|nr:hypothetical protein EVAR_65377_1 [Eumeta japonica]